MTNPYWASNFDAFEQFGDALTQALQSATESKVEGLGFEGQIQLVFFHPQYVSVWKSISASGAQFFIKSFLGDDAAVPAQSSGGESAPPRYRAGVASMAWRTTRRFSTNAP